MPARWKPLVATGAVVIAGGICAATAIAAPTAATLPTISGTGVLGTTLTCENGTWSAGAGAFTYTWELADGDVVIGTGTTLTVRAAYVGLGIQCAVGATDPTGSATATSAARTALPATPAIIVTRARQILPGKIEIRGRVNPVASLDGGAGSLILYRRTTQGPEQLSFNGPQTRPDRRSGSFTLIATGEPRGRHTYIIQYVAGALGYGFPVTVRRTITVS